MTLRITECEFKLLSDLIERECGILLGANKAYLIENRLSRLAEENSCVSFGELYLKAKTSFEARRLSALIVDAITVNETFWFRDLYPFQMLKDVVLPEYQKEIDGKTRKQIRIWSCGCSTGQEPYSIAITALDFCRLAGVSSKEGDWIEILATDVSSTSISHAIKGRYDSIAITRGLSRNHRERYFEEDLKSWIITDEVKNLVTFKPLNLKLPFPGIGSFEAIFLRNVLIYFSDAFKREIFDHMARLLSPGGYLFLGTGETVNGYTSEFEIVSHDCNNVYRLKSRRK